MEQKSLWSKASEYLKVAVPLAIKKYAPEIAIKVFGKAGGLYTWIVTVGFKKLWAVAKPYFEEKGYIADILKWAKAQMPKLEQNKKDIPVDEKIKNESDFLNGPKP